ncbi:MAG: hypothetical protein FWC40_00640 [Proteobacteria bacterium]|nr:hypothetical protein [Pseudomonadota bacterium]
MRRATGFGGIRITLAIVKVKTSLTAGHDALAFIGTIPPGCIKLFFTIPDDFDFPGISTFVKIIKRARDSASVIFQHVETKRAFLNDARPTFTSPFLGTAAFIAV